MGFHGRRPAAIASLLLATIAFTIVVAESHGHESLEISSAHGPLPAFSAGHEQPDLTLHIESATRLEAEPCIGCLQRQRQRADGLLETVLLGIAPSSWGLAETSIAKVAIDARRLPPSRAPPRA